MFSLYVHIPFCERKCPYCDFYSIPYKENIEYFRKYISYLIKEVDLHIKRQQLEDRIVDTIYFGGGTPSLFSPTLYEPFFDFLRKTFRFTENPEITLEANPKTFIDTDPAGYIQLGFNRISIGVQSFNDGVLKGLERIHTTRDSIDAVQHARDGGFGNISIDLIYGSPEQTLSIWESDLQTCIDLAPQHCSVYGLTIHEDTPFYQYQKQLRLSLPDNDEQAEMFTTANDALTAAGYEHYEISNYSLRGSQSRHNMNYWHDGEYLGLGVSAHSHMRGERFANPQTLREYFEELDKDNLVSFHDTPVNKREILGEKIMINIRLLDGFNIDFFNKRYEIDLLSYYEDEIAELNEKGLIEIVDGNLRLTDFGVLFADDVILRFF